MQTFISEEQWLAFHRDGFLKLGRVLNDADLSALQQRIDEIMLGKAAIDYDQLLMQLDSEDGSYENAGKQSSGHKGATLNYRKIQNLERDPLFLAFMQRPIFKEMCDRTYGSHTAISCFRAMFMNKPAHRGTWLPWHQDRWVTLDRDPLLTVWTALDDATIENGCVQLIPGSHRFGVFNPEHNSGFMTAKQAAELCPKEKVVHLQLKAGEAALLHNWTSHASDVNKSDISRRAFSVCYMDARTCTRDGNRYPVVFGPGALTPDGVADAAPAKS